MPAKYNTWLWRIDAPAAAGPGYLFGTTHLFHPSVYEWAAPARAAIDRSTLFAAEYDLAQSDRLQAGLLTLPTADLRAGLGEERYRKANRIAATALGLSLDRLPPAPPIFLLSILTRQLLQLSNGRNLDDELYSYATRQNLRTTGLESIERQLEILQAMDVAGQLRQIRSLLRHPARHRRRFQKTIERYQRGRMIELYRSVRASLGKDRHPLLYERNRRMSTRFLALAENECLFAAVGAGHLWGKYGMLRLLKQAGSRLTPLPKTFQ